MIIEWSDEYMRKSVPTLWIEILHDKQIKCSNDRKSLAPLMDNQELMNMFYSYTFYRCKILS